MPSSDYNIDVAETEDSTAVTRLSFDKEDLVVAVVVSCSLLVIIISAILFICSRRRRYVKGSKIDSDKYPAFFNTSG